MSFCKPCPCFIFLARSHSTLPGRRNVSTSAATITWPSPSRATWCLWCRMTSRARSWETASPWQTPRCLRHWMVRCPFLSLALLQKNLLPPCKNAAFLFFFKAYDQYLNLTIDRKKLVMGLPWYGYNYPCLNLSEVRCCSFHMFTSNFVLGIVLVYF